MHSNNSNNSNKNNDSNSLKGTGTNSLKGTGTNANNHKNNDSLKGTGTNSNSLKGTGTNSLKGTGTNANNHKNNDSLKGTGTTNNSNKNNDNNNSLKGTGTNTSNNNRKRVLRFEFSNAIIESVMGFTTVHQYDDRKTYKEAWTKWLAMEDAAALFKAEVARLTNLGYKGDVADKLFKSGRYYFRGATSAPRTPNDANGVRRGQGMSRQGTSRQGTSRAEPLCAEPLCAEPLCVGPKALNALNQGSLHADPTPLGVRGASAPRKYVTMGRELLRAMDEHIERGLRTNDAYTPAIGFSDFFRTYASSDLLKAEVGNLIRHYETVPNPAKKLHAKLKKTYKNRYFMMVQCNQ
jgi:hypothetical protein